MTVVLLAPIGLDAGCWEWVELPEGRVVRHVYPRAAADLGALADGVLASHDGELDLVGVSLGGMVAQHAALRAPERVRSLLLVCTNSGGRSDTMLDRAAAVEAGGMAAVVPGTLERWFTPEALAQQPEHPGVAYARRTLLALEPRSFAAGWRAIAGHDVQDRLGEIEAPTTVVAGTRDTASTAERVSALAAAIPTARYVELDGPHMIQLERPAAFGRVVREHLDWVDGSAA